MKKIKRNIEGKSGYFTGLSLTPVELDNVRYFIREQWLRSIENQDQKLVEKFRCINMDQYHEISDLVDHSKMWPVTERVLGADAVNYIRNTSLFSVLRQEFGDFQISGEHGVEPEEIVWRLVRPASVSDVGPLHADEWFWKLGNGTTPDGYQRFKVWISIFGELGTSGFKFVSGSHKKNWNYDVERRDGILKPKIADDVSNLKTKSFKGIPGQAIIFHDKLIHGGEVGILSTRVSIEFTIFTKQR